MRTEYEPHNLIDEKMLAESEYLTVTRFEYSDGDIQIEFRYWDAGTHFPGHTKEQEDYWSARITEVIGVKSLHEQAESGSWLKVNSYKNTWYFNEDEVEKILEYFSFLTIAMEP